MLNCKMIQIFTIKCLHLTEFKRQFSLQRNQKKIPQYILKKPIVHWLDLHIVPFLSD